MVPARTFALVIPTLNEAGNLELLLEQVRASLQVTGVDYEVLVVDDNSTDGTQDVVRRVAARDPRVRLLVRIGQKGLAGAVLHGWAHSEAEWLGVMDADLQHPPALLPELLRKLDQGHDVVVASRYANADSLSGWNPARRLISSIGTWVTQPLQRNGNRVRDPLSGYFVLRREVIEGASLKPQGFKILLEVLVRGKVHSAAEVPFRFGLRHAGKSKAGLKVGLEYFAQLGRLSRNVIFRLGH